MKPNYIPYEKGLVEKARENRKNPTPAERKIWFEMFGRKSFGGLKFTRQKPLGQYIVDFYCSELKLVIEVDGNTHAEQENYDKKRTKQLQQYGITVLRYTNRDVMCNIEGVYHDLLEKVQILKGRG